jgi:hypothetical protein
MTAGSPAPTDKLLRVAAAVRALQAVPDFDDVDLARYAERLGSALAASDDINVYAPDRHDRFLAVAKKHGLEADELRIAMALRSVVDS